MLPESTAPPQSLGERSAIDSGAERRDGFWVALVGSLDAVLRSYYGIAEFTNDPDCVFRLGLIAAREPVLLSDGTEIRPGEPVGTLHFWNEQLPPYRARGPELRWAADMRRRLVHSLRALADFVETDPAWREVKAFRGEAPLSSRLGTLQLGRVSHRYGFEQVPADSSFTQRLHRFGECVVAWSLARAFNPAAASRQQFLRPYHQLWISRRALIRFYGRPKRTAGCGPGGA